MAKPKETPRPTTPPKFKVGDTVRVKAPQYEVVTKKMLRVLTSSFLWRQ